MSWSSYSVLAFATVLVTYFYQLRCAICSDCSNKPVIFNFGDSNSDTGSYPAAMGYKWGYPDGRAISYRLNDRASDGRLIIDFLCENVTTNYLSAYLNLLDSDFSNGVNFAFSGAATKYSDFSLDVQIRQYQRFHNRSILLQSKGYKTPVGEDDFKKAVYTFDIGQNDLTGIFRKFPDDQNQEHVLQRMPLIISRIEDAMWAIYEEGGRKFWMHNTGPLGCLPEKLGTRKPNASELDEYGCIARMNEAAEILNSRLKDLCEKLRHEMKDSTIVYVDVYSIKYGLIQNSSSYGFKNPLMACCGYGGPPYNFDPDLNKQCRAATHAYTVCEQEKEGPYISWDGIHYTEAANTIVASAILSGKYSMPSQIAFTTFFCA